MRLETSPSAFSACLPARSLVAPLVSSVFRAVIDRHASDLGIDVGALHVALADGSALTAVKESESLGRQYGVHGTPAWFLAERLISGLLRASDFERIARAAEQLGR